MRWLLYFFLVIVCVSCKKNKDAILEPQTVNSMSSLTNLEAYNRRYFYNVSGYLLHNAELDLFFLCDDSSEDECPKRILLTFKDPISATDIVVGKWVVLSGFFNVLTVNDGTLLLQLIEVEVTEYIP